MTTPLDLNSFLTPLLTGGSLADLQGLIDLSLDPDRILTEILQTKRYEALPLFLPLLHLKKGDERTMILAKMMAQAFLDEDEEAVGLLRRHLQEYVKTGQIAFCCGQLATSLSASHNYRFHMEYEEGLISVDNLELFLLHRGSKPISDYLLESAGHYCAKRIMDHFGYSHVAKDRYLCGAFAIKNQDTIRHLFDRVEDKISLPEGIKCFTFSHSNSVTLVSFARWLLREGFLQFNEEDWEELKVHSSIYFGLQSDV